MNRGEKLKVMNDYLTELKREGADLIDCTFFRDMGVIEKHSGVYANLNLGYDIPITHEELANNDTKERLRKLIKCRLSGAIWSIRELTEDVLKALEEV